MELAALAISILALALAALTALKMRKLEFCPEVVGGDVILPRESRPGDRVRLLLPLHFSNAGHAGGVIEWVALRVTSHSEADRPVLFSPVAEVDMQRFIHARRALSEECTEPFTGFALDARRAASKFILFDVAERARAQPFSIGTGRHYFELFVKASNARAPKLERRAPARVRCTPHRRPRARRPSHRACPLAPSVTASHNRASDDERCAAG